MFCVQFGDDSSLLPSISIAAPVIIHESLYDPSTSYHSVWVSHEFSNTFPGLIKLLDSNVDVVILDFESIEPLSIGQIEDGLQGIPYERLALRFTPDGARPSSGPNFNALAPLIKYFIICDAPSTDIIIALQVSLPNNDFFACSGQTDPKLMLEKGLKVVCNASQLSIGPNAGKYDFLDVLLLNSKSDRPDGLFTTIVVDEQGVALGLCYSSKESISKSLESKTGVYHSRTRGIWYKGKTSGATQTLQRIDLDCDSDTLRFTVNQKEPGFCHLNSRTCFGADTGITTLYLTLNERLRSAPPNSYTKRLFDDKKLLHSKIMEEADELVTARSKDEVAWETADLIYFAMVKCVSEGVSLSDIEKHLDLRSKKISRRAGDAKVPQITDAEKHGCQNLSIRKFELGFEEYQMAVHHLSTLQPGIYKELLLRPILKTEEILERVKPIMKKVREGGDKAVREFTLKFDQVNLKEVALKAPFPQALMELSAEVKSAIDIAYSNIEKFHVAQLESEPLVVETMKGVVCSRFTRPIEKVGLYVPGGTAVLPSSALMLGIPAKVAGCKEIVIATPPRIDGSIVPEVVYVAHRVGASMILKAGGAQAVAAMAYGTESVPKVDKICGPGNQYVTTAKMVAQSDSSALLAIDMPAGPSELLVIADDLAVPKYVVSDLLSQAEHGEDSQVVLLAVGLSEAQIQNYQIELRKQSIALARSDIIKISLSKSFILAMDSMKQALEFSNEYAPEHLILQVENPSTYIDQIANAGSIFVGPWSPESCGDYASGTNHTLPTYGYAKMYSGVNTNTFLKHITTQTLSKEGLDAIGDAVVTLATVEGLDAHRNAVSIRLNDIRRK